MSRRVNIGIIGLDHWYLAYACASTILDIPNLKLIAVSDFNKKRAATFAEKYNLKTIFANYEELLKEKALDAVIICTSSDRIATVAIDAAEADKHILCNKPMALTLNDAEKVVKAADSTGIKFMIPFITRFSPQYVKVRDIVSQGILGKILFAYVTSFAMHGLPKAAPDVEEPGWFTDPEKSGGGALIDTGIFDVDLIKWCLGKGVKKVYAELGTLIYDLKVEDCARVTLRFENGSIGTIDSSWAVTPIPPTYHPHQPSLTIVGTDGMLVVDPYSQPVTIYGRKKPFEGIVYYDLSEPPIKSMMKHFAGCITEDRRPIATGRDGVAALEIVLAAYESARKGAPVML